MNDCQNCKYRFAHIVDHERIKELEKQISALKTALEFYAKPATHKHVITEGAGIEIPIINDNGEIARAALDGWSSGEIRELEDSEK
jgi:hypothetical protein